MDTLYPQTVVREIAMRTVEVTSTCTAGRDRVWELVGSPATWGEWLSIHKAWKGEPPATPAEGQQAVASGTVMNMPISVDWTFEKVQAPSALVMTGLTRANVKLTLDIALLDDGPGTTINLSAAIDGGMIDGPMGGVFKRSLEGALKKSLLKLGELASS